MIRPAHRQPRLGIDRHQSHQPHQPLDSLSVDPMSLSLKPSRHPADTIKRPLGELFVDQPHERQVVFILARRLEVEG